MAAIGASRGTGYNLQETWRESLVRPLALAWPEPDALDLLRCCYGVATVLVPWASLGHPLGIPWVSLVHPLYTHGDFGNSPASPPSPRLALTALVQSLFKGNRIFVPFQFSAAISSPFLPLDFGLWTFRPPPRPSASPIPAPLPLPLSPARVPATIARQKSPLIS
jgi:hypothetical protein